MGERETMRGRANKSNGKSYKQSGRGRGAKVAPTFSSNVLERAQTRAPSDGAA